MKKHINQIEKYLKNNFIYYTPNADIIGNDLYFCKCGNKIKAHPNETSFTLKVQNNEYGHADMANFGLDSFGSAFRKANIICPHCHINYTEAAVYQNIQNLNVNFFDKYVIHEDKNKITLYKYRAGGSFDLEKQEMSIKVIDSYITISKKSHQVKYKGFSKFITERDAVYDFKKSLIDHNKDEGFKYTYTVPNPEEIKAAIKKRLNVKPESVQLENIISISKEFFKSNGDDTIIIDGFINIHDFIGKTAKIIVDAKNMHIVEELMGLMIGKSGTSVLQKTLAIFMGILIYPNLSTIALTKGNIFLYELLENSPMPKKSYLRNQNATSPLKIFNALVSLKNKELQSDLDSDDRNKLGYEFRTKNGLKFNLNFRKENLIKNNTNITKDENGAKIFVRDKIVNKKISPYIFNKLTTFSDYGKVIKWLKFISYDNLINLVKQYNIDVLDSIFKKIEFREDIDINRLNQLIPLMMDYVKNIQDTNPYDINVSDAINTFDFSIYDDCMRMIHELKWNPAKVFYKIKQVKKLTEFHDKLMEYRSYVSDAEANKKYLLNSEKFLYLEGNKKNIEDHPYYDLDITLIKTPKELLDKAVEMHNCAGSYINKVAEGQYIPFIVHDRSVYKEKMETTEYMMILEVTNLGLEFVGIKSAFNQYGSDRFKSEVKNYLIDNDISFKEVLSIKPGVNSTERTYLGTFEKVEYTPNIKRKIY